MGLPWIAVSPRSPYFVTESGSPWTPIGHNDSIEWPGLHGLFRRRDLEGVRTYLRMLADSGVTVLRLMLEYCHHEHRYFEKPAGIFRAPMVKLWDDLFGLCGEFGLRILLTPFDTFWLWRRWKYHPYNAANGGPCKRRAEFFLCPETRRLVKRRVDFVTERWGSSGAIFAWDIWNELHPAFGLDSIEHAVAFISDISGHLRETEMRLFGRTHLQTTSTFLPLAQQRPELNQKIYGHPALDFATTHFYEEGTIDHPRDTVQPAVSTGKLVDAALSEVPASKPFMDSEHGPIHTFKDHHRTLPEAFDDEYFRHMQWAHLASGAAGGGMRWPNRHPHLLTPGMHAAQQALTRVLPEIDWTTLRRTNWNQQLEVLGAARVAAFGCGDERQALLWLLRLSPLARNGMLHLDAHPIEVRVRIPWTGGTITAQAWDTATGTEIEAPIGIQDNQGTSLLTPLWTRDIAIVLRRNPAD